MSVAGVPGAVIDMRVLVVFGRHSLADALRMRPTACPCTRTDQVGAVNSTSCVHSTSSRVPRCMLAPNFPTLVPPGDTAPMASRIRAEAPNTALLHMMSLNQGRYHRM